MDTIDLKAIAVVLHREVSRYLVKTLSAHPTLSDDERRDLVISVLTAVTAEAVVGVNVDPLQVIQRFWQQYDAIDHTLILMDWAHKPHEGPPRGRPS